jgi:IclR family KDG regulon transcriptional repressor
LRTIDKTLDIFESINKLEGKANFEQLSGLTNLNQSAIRRICSRLVTRGYLQKELGSKTYSLGIKFIQFNNVISSRENIKEESLPSLKKLSDIISESIILAVLDNTEPRDILNIVPERSIRVSHELNAEYPMHCTSIGKLFLANMPENKMESIIKLNGLAHYTRHTISNLDQLKKELESIRHSGIAFDNEEFRQYIRSAAAPIRYGNGDILAAVAFIAPSFRVSAQKMKLLAPLVKNTARELSRIFGYNPEQL